MKSVVKLFLLESFRKFNFKENKINILIIGAILLLFLSYNIYYVVPSNNISNEQLREILVLGLLQVLPLSFLSFILVRSYFDVSENLYNFFVFNKISTVIIRKLKYIIEIILFLIVENTILLIQSGIPLYQGLGCFSFIKFVLITNLLSLLVFICLDLLFSYLNDRYRKYIGEKYNFLPLIIIEFIVFYFFVYYLVLKILFNELIYSSIDFVHIYNHFDFLKVLLLFVIVVSLNYFYIKCNKFNNVKMVITKNYLSLFKWIYKINSVKLLPLISIIRSKKMIFLLVITFFAESLALVITDEIEIAYLFSFISCFSMLNLYSQLENNVLFYKLSNQRYWILTITLAFIMFNIPFIVNILFYNIDNISLLFELFVFYILSSIIGFFFSRNEGSINKFMSNFIFTVIVLSVAMIPNISNDVKVYVSLVMIVVEIIFLNTLFNKMIRKGNNAGV